MLFLLVITFLLALAKVLAYDKDHDCNRLFIKNGAPSPAGFDYRLQNCQKDGSAPTEVESTKTDVYHFNEVRGWADEGTYIMMLNSVHEAIREAITEYSKYAIIPDVYIFIVRDDLMTDYSATTYKHPDERCRVKLNWSVMKSQNMDVNKQTIAHELWHCAQFQQFGNAAGTGAVRKAFHWWVDGSADYFSNVVYPTVNHEHLQSANYDASKPLYEQGEGYQASVFFQSLEKNPKAPQTPSAIWEWMKRFTVVDNVAAEAARIAALPEIADWLPTFMEAQAGAGVPDSDGVSLVPHNGLFYHILADTTFSDAAPAVEHETYVAGLAGNKQLTSLSGGQTVELSYVTTNKKVSLKYQIDIERDAEPSWSEVLVGSPVTLIIPCGERMPINLLNTNIGDADETVTIKFTRKSKDKKCCRGRDGRIQEAPALRKRFIPGDTRYNSFHNSLAAVEAEVDGPTSGLDAPANGSEEEAEACELEESHKCLVGSWSLNLEAMEELMRQALVIPDVPEVQISNIDITGSSVLSIGDAWIGNWTYDVLTVAFDVNTLDLGAQHTRTVLNGDLGFALLGLSNTTDSGEVVAKRQEATGEQGEFTMRTIAASGTVVSYSPLLGEINWPMDASYVPPDLILKYVCTHTTLALTGFQGGAPASGWVYAFNRI